MFLLKEETEGLRRKVERMEKMKEEMVNVELEKEVCDLFKCETGLEEKHLQCAVCSDTQLKWKRNFKDK